MAMRERRDFFFVRLLLKFTIRLLFKNIRIVKIQILVQIHLGKYHSIGLA